MSTSTSDFLTLEQAYRFATALQALARDAGLGTPEIRPSSPSPPGSPIFLPYRGAQVDGYGCNPPLDPSADYHPIPLYETMTRVRRNSVTAVHYFLEQVKDDIKPATVVRAEAQSKMSRAAPVTSARTPEINQKRFADELERIAPHYVEGKRQNLVMGITAYAVRELELAENEVQKTLMDFCRKTDDDEVAKRHEAVTHTLAKYRQGIRVAWRPYYVLVGVAPPVGDHYTPGAKALEQLARAKALLERQVWQPRTGYVDRAVFAAILTFAEQYGREHDAGVLVCVSTRELALKAGTAHPTVMKALKRLGAQGLVQRVSTRDQIASHSGELVIMTKKVSKLYHSDIPTSSVVGGLSEWSTLHTHAAFRHGKLNKSAIGPLNTLVASSQPLTRSEMAKRLGKKSRTLSKPLAKLLEHHIIMEIGGRYKAAAYWQEALERAAIKTGARLAEKQALDLYEVQRHEFAKVLARRRR